MMSSSRNQILYLNVGGHQMATSLSTLLGINHKSCLRISSAPHHFRPIFWIQNDTEAGQIFYEVIQSSADEESILWKWFSDPEPPLPIDKNGAYFIDRDPWTFGIILNYLRLRIGGQLWEACLPKDPDRLALLTQEADYFQLTPLRQQAIALLQTCSDVDYFNQVMVESKSCPMGLSAILGAAKKQKEQRNQEDDDSDTSFPTFPSSKHN